MKIKRLSVYKTDLPYVGGTYQWGAGNAIEVAKSTVITIDTDTGISGCGEFTPCGENYMVAHSEGVTSVATHLAPKVLNQDPRQTEHIDRLLDQHLQGHGYAKSPIINACWDIPGKATQQPVWMLPGGKLTDGAPMYRVAPQKDIKATRAELKQHRKAGYRQFQIKVGADRAMDIERIRQLVPLLEPGEKAIADANQGWRIDNAIRVAKATRDLDFILEQPCHSYEECQQVRSFATQAMKLDECITDIKAAMRVVHDRGAEIICLKISNPGGLSKARKIRDFLIDNRIPVVPEDTRGGEITSAAVAHLAASTPQQYLINSTDLMNYSTRSTGIGGPIVDSGMLYATDTPGLGVEPDFDSLGDPVFVFE